MSKSEKSAATTATVTSTPGPLAPVQKVPNKLGTGVEQTSQVVKPMAAQRQPQPVSEEQVRLRAYQKWEAAGKPSGKDMSFWLEAERELRGR